MWPPCRIDFPNGSKNAQIDLQPRSRLLQTPQRGPGLLTTRRRAQTWCSLFVAPCAPEGTPPVSNRLRPRWAAFLSILMVEWWIVYEESFFADSFDDSLGGFHFNDVAHGWWIHGGIGNSGGIRSEGRCHSCWRLCLIRPGGNA